MLVVRDFIGGIIGSLELDQGYRRWTKYLQESNTAFMTSFSPKIILDLK